jgi:carboxyl-terminal processing protease
MSTEDVMRRLKGPKGTLVDVKVLRRGVPELLSFTIRRDKIPVYSLDASYMIAPQTGYIKINRFAATTHAEFMNALASLKSQGMKDLILDLQGNGGGYLNAAIDIANEFLGDEELIVYTEGRRSARRDFYADGNGKHQYGKLVVLVDEYSASASEIVSGAVQDWDRGVVVGRRTFGKGLVQRPLQMPDGSMLRLTVAHYYTPTGRSIQRPYSMGDNGAYRNDIIERYKRGEMISADSIHFVDSLKYTTLKNHRTVFGGGGIMPDCFIPLDTTNFTTYHRDIVAKGVMPQLAAEYSEKNKKDILSQYKRESKFVEEYQVSDSLMLQLTELAAKEGVEYKADEYETSKELMSLQMKALIARDLYEQSSYYKVINTGANEALKRALDIIANDEEYNSLLGNKNKK